jgi:uncharacterized protein YgiB involved in biofilm formation
MSLSAALGACDDDPQPKVYQSVAECQADHGEQACDSAWQASVGEHTASAPQFQGRDPCEAQYGAGHCEAYSTPTGSVFIPLMAGFMIGRVLSRSNDSSSNPYSGGGGGGVGYVGHPVFFNAAGGYSAPPARPGEALFTRSAGFTERAGFGRAGGFHFGGRGG